MIGNDLVRFDKKSKRLAEQLLPNLRWSERSKKLVKMLEEMVYGSK